jgi:FKBP-type peptidyl-prolyl cis-trans isomerase FklB
MNYALGLMNGSQLKMYQLRNDSSIETVAEFMDALQRGYDGKVEQLGEVAAIGKNIGQAIKASEATGLADNPAWTLNEKLFFQGLVNALYNDTVVMNGDAARNYFQAQYQASAMSNDSVKAGKAIKGKCPSDTKVVTLANQNDSVNYAFGYLNGSEVAMYVLAMDSTGEQKKEFIAYINKGLKSNIKNPQLVGMGEQIGKSIKEQEAVGLIGEPSLSTNFELIKQGFVNGLLGATEQWNSEFAGEYIQSTMATIKYGQGKEEGEKFLAENALKEGVTTTPSGLQYEVIKMGKGKKPVATDKVKVHYHGTLINGTVFDSSVDRNEPITFGLTQVIAGWTEGLQLMPVGSKFKLYIPYQLGYGSQQAGSIPPYSTLIFEVELLGIEK